MQIRKGDPSWTDVGKQPPPAWSQTHSLRSPPDSSLWPPLCDAKMAWPLGAPAQVARLHWPALACLPLDPSANLSDTLFIACPIPLPPCLALRDHSQGRRGSVCHQIHAVRLGRLRAEGQPLTHLVGHVPRNPHLGCPLRRPDVFYLTKSTFRKLEAIGALLASVVSVFRQTDLLHTSEDECP